jgi:uncharacterized protein YcnI
MKETISRKIRSLWMFMATFLACVGLSTAVASAHVTVWPKTSSVGAWEKYTMRVPTEKDVPTTKIVLRLPAGVEFESYEPVPGWTCTVQAPAGGKSGTVTWKATGAGILPGQFQEFSFVAKNPDKAGSLAWDAYQYYKDGSVVEWTGAEGSQTPHSITQITTASPTDVQGAPSQQATQQPTTQPAPQPTTQPAGAAGNAGNATLPRLSMGLSVAAIVLSLGAFVRGRRKPS